MPLGIDTSHHAGTTGSAIPTAAQVKKAYDFGVRFWIVGLQNHEVFIPTIERVLDHGGIIVEDYTYLYTRLGPQAQIDWGMNKLEQAGLFKHVFRHWHDWETGVEQPLSIENGLYKSIQFSIENTYKSRGGGYTARWWWHPNVPQNDPVVGATPLWNAYYDGQANEHWVPYGAWQRQHTKQFQGTTDLYGINCDLNYRPEDIYKSEAEAYFGGGEDDLSTPQALLAALKACNYDELGAVRQYIDAATLSFFPVEGFPADYPLTDIDERGRTTGAQFNHYLRSKEPETGHGAGLPPEKIREIIYEAFENALSDVRLYIPEEN